MHQQHHSRCVMCFRALCHAPTLQLKGGKKGLILQFTCCVISEDDSAISRYQRVVVLSGSERSNQGTEFSREQFQLNRTSALIGPAWLANARLGKWKGLANGIDTPPPLLCTPATHSCGNKSQLQPLHTCAVRSSVNTPVERAQTPARGQSKSAAISLPPRACDAPL